MELKNRLPQAGASTKQMGKLIHIGSIPSRKKKKKKKNPPNTPQNRILLKWA
jgi:hypothetical protein